MTPLPSLPTATDQTGDYIGYREYDGDHFFFWWNRPLDRIQAVPHLTFVADSRSAEEPRAWLLARVESLHSNSATVPASALADLRRTTAAIRSLDRSILEPSTRDLAERALRSLEDREEESPEEWATRIAEGIRGVND